MRSDGSRHYLNYYDSVLTPSFPKQCTGNSLYGFQAVKKTSGGKLTNLVIAAAITACGRGLLEYTQQYVRDGFLYTTKAGKRIRMEMPEKAMEGDIVLVPEIIYGDTDSVMVKIQETHGLSDDESVEIFEFFGNLVTEKFDALLKENGYMNSKIILEFEKWYENYFLPSKKHYAGIKFVPGKPRELSTSGMDTRSKAVITRELMASVFDQRICKNNGLGALMEIQNTLEKILNNEYPLEKYVISVGINKREYSDPEKSTAAQLKLQLARSGTEVNTGERVSFIVGVPRRVGGSVASKAIPLKLATLKDVCRCYYINQQLKKPIIQMMTYFEDYTKEQVTGLFETYYQRIAAQQMKNNSLDNYMTTEAKKITITKRVKKDDKDKTKRKSTKITSFYTHNDKKQKA